MLAKAPAEVEVYNDLNGELVNFFRVLKESPAEFKAAWKWCLVSREEFNRLRDADTTTMAPVERAYRFLYVNRAAFGGDMEGKGCVFGVKARDPSELVGWLKRVTAWTDALHDRLKYAYIENMPAIELIERWGASKPERHGAVFFCDPPYVDTKEYAVGAFTQDDHRALAAKLGSLKGRFLLTINDHPLIRELYDGCYMLERTKQYSISRSDEGRRAYGELIISNYPLPTQKQAAFEF